MNAGVASKIRKGDQVIVITGKDKGKPAGDAGRPAKDRVFVEGLNIVKRHQHPQTRATAQTAGGVIEKRGPIHLSNVALIDPKDDKPTRVRIEREDGKRVRVAVRSGARLD